MDIDFKKGGGLVPAIIQDFQSRKVLMLGYMNEEALQKTLKEGKVTFFSRSKQRLWTKGETSGNHLLLKQCLKDCDNDTLLILAEPTGPVCHKGTESCFPDDTSSRFLYKLQAIIANRKSNPESSSYTSSLFKEGINKIAQKVGEEAVELIIEAKDDNDLRFKDEAADLLYHFLVLLQAKNIDLEDIEFVLETRH